MSGWDEAAGRVSQSFNDWFLIDGDQRAFLGLGLAFAKEVYERIWDEAGREPADPDGPEQIDIFEQRVHGLHQHDYEWDALRGDIARSRHELRGLPRESTRRDPSSYG